MSIMGNGRTFSERRHRISSRMGLCWVVFRGALRRQGFALDWVLSENVVILEVEYLNKCYLQ